MRRSRKAINQMNVVPYIDVMLVLLVIFMVTAPLITGQVELPTMSSQASAPVQPLEVTLRPDGTFSLRNTASNVAPVRLSRAELVGRVQAALALRPDQPVVIAADRGARYEDVLGVLDLLKRNGVQKVGLLVRQAS
ncbi:MAG: ExbD/TolR family protein [Burkholderiales bacterium]|nr:ExbD/TolR family protein [Burkholderiales bacterium]GIK87546.1 MAG: protein TolR [Betaproteobacteria bacterium]